MPVKPARGARARAVTSLSNFNWALAMKLARGARDSVLVSCRFSEVLTETTFIVFYRNVETQTKRESSTNVPKPSTFVAGLRGCNSTKTTMNVVDLTLDVDQT